VCIPDAIGALAVLNQQQKKRWGLCLNGFVFNFIFSDYFVFPHLAGSLGNSGVYIFVCCSLFCEFLDVLYFQNFSFWLVFVLS